MAPTRRTVLAGAALAIIAAVAVIARAPHIVSGWPDPTDPRTTLADVEAAVSRKIPVPEISVPEFGDTLSQPDTMIFDVREPSEFARSHISGATRIDPGLSAAAFAARFGNEIRGKKVVFYCAVGVRSGTMLERVRSVLSTGGATSALNLKGGIFRWYASGRPLVADTGVAHDVHHYDEAWGKLLARTVAAGTHDAR